MIYVWSHLTTLHVVFLNNKTIQIPVIKNSDKAKNDRFQM